MIKVRLLKNLELNWYDTTHVTEELVEPVVPGEDRVTRHTHQEDLNMIRPQ